MRRFPKKKNIYGLKEIDDSLKQAKLERHQVGAPAIGCISSTTEIGAVVVRICSQLEEHGKMLDNHGKILEQISIFTVGYSTLSLRDTLLLRQYQFSTLEKIVKRKREGGNEKEDGKWKKAEPRTWQRDLQQKYQKIEEKKKYKGEWQKNSNANKKNKKAEEADVPLKKKVEGTKIEDFSDEQFDHNIQSTIENLLQQVTPGEGLDEVKDLMVDDDVEMNLEAISSKYGGGLLKWKKSDEKDNDDNINVEENVKSKKKQPQVAEEEDSEPPTVVVYYNIKKMYNMPMMYYMKKRIHSLKLLIFVCIELSIPVMAKFCDKGWACLHTLVEDRVRDSYNGI
ncbi:hypothetical protein GIB67_009739, partial [Kingdonia uniflora]